MRAPARFRLLAPLLAIAACAVSGWGLRAVLMPETPRPAAGEARVLPPAEARAPAQAAAGFSAAPAGASQAAKKDPPSATPVRIAEILERLFQADPNDMIEMIDGLGALSALTDAEVRLAWRQLVQRMPSRGFGARLTALYLWGRMGRLGEDLPLPAGWEVEEMVVAVASERARRGGEQGTEKILARLEAGEPVSEIERRVVFGQMARADPLAAVKLWCRVTKPGDFEQDAPWMGDALTDPATRSAVMAEVRKWQAGGGGNVAGTTSFLLQNWLRRDPAAVAQWLAEPAQADLRSALMPEVVAARAGADPVGTWNWAQTLPEQQRRHTLRMSAAQLAGTDPDAGVKLIAALPASAARQEVVATFGEALAAQDISRWRQWRDTLPRAEQDAVNASAFSAWVAGDTQNAVAWLEARPAGAEKDALVTVVVETYAKNDPAGAARWIASIPDPVRREEAFQSALVMAGFNDLERVRILLDGLAAR